MKGWLYGLALVGLLALAACAAQEKETSVPAAAPAAPAAKPAWEEEWERVLAAAKREGKVTLLTGIGGPEVRLTGPVSDAILFSALKFRR